MRVLYHAQNYPHRSRYLRTRNYAIVATLLMTGLRAQELLALRNEDVRLPGFRVPPNSVTALPTALQGAA